MHKYCMSTASLEGCAENQSISCHLLRLGLHTSSLNDITWYVKQIDTFIPAGCKVQYVTIDLPSCYQNLQSMPPRLALNQAINDHKTKGSLNKSGDSLHANGEAVARGISRVCLGVFLPCAWGTFQVLKEMCHNSYKVCDQLESGQYAMTLFQPGILSLKIRGKWGEQHG